MYWVSCRMAARSERNAQPPRSSSVALIVSSAGLQDGRFQGGQRAQAGGLAERDEADGGGNQVGGEGLEIGNGGGVFGNAVYAATAPTATGYGMRSGASGIPHGVAASMNALP